MEHNKTKILVMDGGQGTEIENRGIDISNPVWSTTPFLNSSFWSNQASREREIVKSIFQDFINAGSEILRTPTYQGSYTAISKNTSVKTLQEYNELLDRIVSFTRETIGDDKYLIGCIGTWGAHICAEYTGNFGLDAKSIDYYGYMQPQLENFNNNKEIDIIGIVTVPNIDELKNIISWDETKIRKPYYVSLSIDEKGLLRDGSTMTDIANVFKNQKMNPNFMYLGINCVNFNESIKILKSIHDVLPQLELIAYPNSGETFDLDKRIWLPNEDTTFSWADAVDSFIESGARVIGGCCRTTPMHINQISLAVESRSKDA